MIRKLLSFLLTAAFLCVPASADDAPPNTSAEAAILVHPASGRVLYARSEHRRMLIASTTKLMTALVAAENLSLDRTAEIRPEWTKTEGSSMYLRCGERYSVRELLEGLLLASGNDAALALAGIAAKDADSFAEMMNERAASLGLTDTHFDNPHGLDSPGQYSTAADLAVLTAEVCSRPELREIMGMRECSVRGLTYKNHNKLLGRCLGVFAGKTGYTKAAGRCLVSCCSRDCMELVCVTLSDSDDWRDHAALYDWAYGVFRQVDISREISSLSIPVIGRGEECVKVVPAENTVFCLKKDTGYLLDHVLAPFIFAPVDVGEPCGCINIRFSDGESRTVLLCCAETISASNDAEKVFREIVDRFIGIYAV